MTGIIIIVIVIVIVIIFGFMGVTDLPHSDGFLSLNTYLH